MRPVFARRRDDRPEDRFAGPTTRPAIPPIDAAAPADLQTATFAAG